ncbi:MAG: GatB/YqeY domain-containing protein [Patescibacteria group bacterium]
MTLQQTIKSQIKEAMMAKDTVRLTVVRGLSSAITNELVTKGKMPTDELSDEDVLAVIRRAVKQRKDSIEQFVTGGRPELAEDEKVELAILEQYLPAMMAEDEVKAIVVAKQAEMGIIDKKDSGKLMAEVMKDLKGKADGMVVKNAVDSLFV